MVAPHPDPGPLWVNGPRCPGWFLGFLQRAWGFMPLLGGRAGSRHRPRGQVRPGVGGAAVAGKASPGGDQTATPGYSAAEGSGLWVRCGLHGHCRSPRRQGSQEEVRCRGVGVTTGAGGRHEGRGGGPAWCTHLWECVTGQQGPGRSERQATVGGTAHALTPTLSLTAPPAWAV